MSHQSVNISDVSVDVSEVKWLSVQKKHFYDIVS